MTARDLSPIIGRSTPVVVLTLAGPHRGPRHTVEWITEPHATELYAPASWSYPDAQALLSFLRAHHPGFDAHIDQAALEWLRAIPGEHATDSELAQWHKTKPLRVEAAFVAFCPAYRIIGEKVPA